MWTWAVCFNNTRDFHFFLSNFRDGWKQQGLSNIKHRSTLQQNERISPLFGLGKLSCRWKTTFSTKCWMLLCSGPRTNTIQSWVKPSTVGFFRTWARWPSSSFTWTAPCETQNTEMMEQLKSKQRPSTLHVCGSPTPLLELRWKCVSLRSHLCTPGGTWRNLTDDCFTLASGKASRSLLDKSPAAPTLLRYCLCPGLRFKRALKVII